MSEGTKPVIRRPVFWYLVLWAILMVVWTSTPYVACEKEQTDQSYSQQKQEGSSSVGVFIRLIWSVETKCTGAFIESSANEIIAIFTIVLAISTSLLWRETERLAEGAKDQSEKMRQSIREQRRSTFAMIVSAKATKRAAETADKALHTLEQPELGVVEMRYFSEAYMSDPASSGVYVAAKFKNFGRSLATIRRIRFAVVVREPNDFWNEIAREEKAFTDREFVSEGEVSGEFKFGPLRSVAPYSDQISNGRKWLILSVTRNFDSLLGRESGGGSTYIWDWQAQKFISGIQLRTEK
jgi:hypothetical protein